MAHVSKQLLDAVTAAATGLTTTGGNVLQSRVYALASAPGLTVRLGERRVVQELSGAVVDAEQDITIDIHVAAPAEQIDDQLLAIEAELYAALAADYTLGLDFVIDARPQGLTEPELEAAERPKAQASSRWTYLVRHGQQTLEA